MSTPRALPFSSNSTSAETPKDLSRWRNHKEVLYDLFIRQDKTLKDVKAIMESDHDFPKTLKNFDYEYVLREKFGYRKNLSANDWRLCIGPEIERRKARGKGSEVLLHGSRIQNINRKISRAFNSSRQRKVPRVKASTTAMPYGVIIKTPPPQSSKLRQPNPLDENLQASQTEQYATNQSNLERLSSFLSRSDDITLSTSLAFFPHEGSMTPALSSAQFLRDGCPINKFVAMSRGYQRAFNQAGLTITALGKVCFDLSNHLEEETMSHSEILLILDWIGSSVDLTLLKTFFSQKALTIRAVLESLNSKVLAFQHVPAFDALSSIRLSTQNQIPWAMVRPIHVVEHSIDIDPCLAVNLVGTYPYPEWQLDNMLRVALTRESPTKVLKQLVSAGARLTNSGPRQNIMVTVIHCSQTIEDHTLDTIDIGRLEILLEAGAVVDEPFFDCTGLGWSGPNQPVYATDCILINEAQSTPQTSRHWALVSPYSNRQQTTVTVPGIFEAIQGGQDRLRSYLHARLKPKSDRLRRQILEVALSEASGRGNFNVVQGLIQFGVDPNVRALPRVDFGSWHPIIRAVNAGQTDTLQVLMAASSIDLALLNEIVGSELDLCALQTMEPFQRDRILQALSKLKFDRAARREILLNAIGSPSHKCLRVQCDKCGHTVPDFEFLGQLLKCGLACLDGTEDLDDETPPILLRAIQQNCNIRALHYLVEMDMEIVPALSGRAIAALVEAALKHSSSPLNILKFLAQKNKRFQSDIHSHAKFFLRRLLQERRCAQSHRFCYGREPERDCECVVAVKWFLDLGLSLESNYGSFLAELVEHASNDSLILEMIHRGADLNVTDQHGRTVLRQSIKRGRLQLAVTLIQRGAYINAPAAPYQRTALQEACVTGAPLWFVTFLLDNGADVNAPPALERGCTALQAACSSGAELSCISLLLMRGAVVNAPPAPAHGFTALQFAAMRGNLNVAGLLLDHGADVNALSGYMLRFSVCRYGMPPTPKFEGFVRAIDLAAFASRLDMVHFLIAAGARSYRPGRTGFDGAIELATSEGHFAVASQLREHSELRTGDCLSAENEWLRDNPQADMYDGRVVPAGLVPFIKRQGGDTDAGLQCYMQMQLGISQP